MKYLILIICLTSNIAFAQKVILPMSNNRILYEEVLTMDSSYTKELLYKATKTWFANVFKSANHVIQSEDFNSGRIIGKGIVAMKTSIYLVNDIDSQCKFTVQIDIKDSKLRYRFYDFFTFKYYNGREYNIDLSQPYAKYLNNEYKKRGLLSTEKLYSKFNETFFAFDQDIAGMVRQLKKFILETKKDDF